ncbi:glucosaminidase domain-containing protein [Ideonella oryzae]|uniref:Glucosaminidase domain-containing protein n=1 Tax=Ideonella oryzae TaxID=2937441 RepID=A0ABT1BNC2_9BURK|nr:glucosaminidase domain-containing protein [Ideonella oryzae]MCO5977077.1 glucosaminidase domain-containing protein [Ideonella oryzae]
MRLPEAPLFPSLAPTPATAPAAGLGAGTARSSAGFGGLYRSLSQEVQDYIAHGDGGPVEGSASTLSAEARARWVPQAPTPADDAAAPTASVDAPARQAFLDQIAPMAAEAGAQLGVDPAILSAQAALESGWGQRPLRNAAGENSHNLFGIKAGAGWQGAVAEAATTEVENGQAVGTTARFRAYADASASFQDLAQLLRHSPRYQAALNTGGDAQAYAQALARGGYATDPAYAAKLTGLARQIQSRGGN